VSLTSAAVSAVLRGAPNAVVQLDLGSGDQAFEQVSCPEWYAPQVGDNVGYDMLGSQIVILACFTPGRLYVPPTAPIPGITSGTAAPGAGWTAAQTMWLRDNGTDIYFEWPSAAPPPPPPPPPTTIQVHAGASRTFDDLDNWRGDGDQVVQGDEYVGASRGCWFYGAGFAPLAGRTINAARLWIKRRGDGSGDSWGPMQCSFWHHPHADQPGGAPTLDQGPWNIPGAAPAKGQELTAIPVPLDLANLLRDAGGGLAIAGNPYFVLEGVTAYPLSGYLEFDVV
jgi:hypothetical protein